MHLRAHSAVPCQLGHLQGRIASRLPWPLIARDELEAAVPDFEQSRCCPGRRHGLSVAVRISHRSASHAVQEDPESCSVAGWVGWVGNWGGADRDPQPRHGSARRDALHGWLGPLSDCQLRARPESRSSLKSLKSAEPKPELSDPDHYLIAEVRIGSLGSPVKVWFGERRKARWLARLEDAKSKLQAEEAASAFDPPVRPCTRLVQR